MKSRFRVFFHIMSRSGCHFLFDSHSVPLLGSFFCIPVYYVFTVAKERPSLPHGDQQ